VFFGFHKFPQEIYTLFFGGGGSFNGSGKGQYGKGGWMQKKAVIASLFQVEEIIH
jgi:hypothetical protein